MKPARVAAWVFAALLVPHATEARTAPNPAGRPGPSFGVTAPDPAAAGAAGVERSARSGDAEHAAPALVQVVPVGLPAGAVQIDSTWYDLQDLGSLGNRMVVAPDGTVHATWQDDFCHLDQGGCPPNPSNPIPFPQRGMAYAYRTPAGSWIRIGKVAQPSIRCLACSDFSQAGGFGTIAVLPGGRVAISQHMQEDACDLRGDVYIQNSPGGSSWTAYLGAISSPSYQFPQVVRLPGGSFVMLAEVPRAVGDCTHCGVNEFRVSRLAAEGVPFTCPVGWQFGAWTPVVSNSIFREGFPAFPSLAATAGGRVGIAVTDFGGNVRLIESSDGSFGAGTITVRNLTNYTDAAVTRSDSTSTQYRPYIHCHLAYNDTTPHVVWSELQARRAGSVIEYFDWRSRIRHWSPGRGITTVAQVQAGEADRYDDVDNGLNGPLAGFNTISVDWPQVGFSDPAGEIYVAWSRFTDANVDPTATQGLPGIVTGTGYGDLMASVARGGGAWSPGENLTGTPKTDERYPMLAARNPGGRVHLLFQAATTDQAGVVQAQDRGTTAAPLLRRIAYLERALAGSLVDVGRAPAGAAGLSVLGNPSFGRVRLSLAGSRDGAAALVKVFSVDGRLVARLSLPRGSAAEWDGRDLAGRATPSGLYLARIEGEPARPVKFMLLR